MLRYCEKCDKSFDFDIKDVRQLDNLTCPECGSHIDKNSRPSKSSASEERVYLGLANAYLTVITVIYLFGLIIACIGCFGFFAKFDTLLFIMSGVSAVILIIQLVTRYTSGFWIFLYVLGTVLGGIIVSASCGIENILRGCCVGFELSIVLRYILRDLFFRLIFKLGSFGGKASSETNIATTHGINQKRRPD